MPYYETGSISTKRVARPTSGVFRGPAHRRPATYIDTPPDGFLDDERDDPSLRLWFLDEDAESGRIGDDLALEYEGRFASEIKAAIDGAVADAEPDPVDFNALSVRLYTEGGLSRLVHVTP